MKLTEILDNLQQFDLRSITLAQVINLEEKLQIYTFDPEQAETCEKLRSLLLKYSNHFNYLQKNGIAAHLLRMSKLYSAFAEIKVSRRIQKF